MCFMQKLIHSVGDGEISLVRYVSRNAFTLDRLDMLDGRFLRHTQAMFYVRNQHVLCLCLPICWNIIWRV